jgi:hypothetical protein
MMTPNTFQFLNIPNWLQWPSGESRRTHNPEITSSSFVSVNLAAQLSEIIAFIGRLLWYTVWAAALAIYYLRKSSMKIVRPHPHNRDLTKL